MKRCRPAWRSFALAVIGGAVVSCMDPPPTPFLAGPLPKPAPGKETDPSGWDSAPVKPGAITRIDVTTLFPLQQSGAVVVIDTRPAIFYHMGHIPGAYSWPKRGFEMRRETHEPMLAAAAKTQRPVVLYCTDRECQDAHAVAERISARGFSVAILEDGYDGWKSAGLPTQ